VEAKDLLRDCQLTDECWDEVLEALLEAQWVDEAVPLLNEQIKICEAAMIADEANASLLAKGFCRSLCHGWKRGELCS
jgi:hypothetical protein